MNNLRKALLIAAVLSLTTKCYADFENIGQGGYNGAGGYGGVGYGGGGYGAAGYGGGGYGGAGAAESAGGAESAGSGSASENIEEGRFLGLLKKGKGRVETYTNYVPYPVPVPVAFPVYQNFGHGGKLGLGKGLIGVNGLAEGFGQGYYQGYPYQYSNIGPVGGYGGFGPGIGPGYGYFK